MRKRLRVLAVIGAFVLTAAIAVAAYARGAIGSRPRPSNPVATSEARPASTALSEDPQGDSEDVNDEQGDDEQGANEDVNDEQGDDEQGANEDVNDEQGDDEQDANEDVNDEQGDDEQDENEDVNDEQGSDARV